MAAILDISLSGSPAPPMLTWVFWRKTLPAELTLCNTSTVPALRFRLPPKPRRLLATSLLLARIGKPVGYVRTVPDIRDG
jgi:hypothetical protein